jgi:hypothetical protein
VLELRHAGKTLKEAFRMQLQAFLQGLTEDSRL